MATSGNCGLALRGGLFVESAEHFMHDGLDEGPQIRLRFASVVERAFQARDDFGGHGPVVFSGGLLDLGFEAFGNSQTEMEVISSHGAEMTQIAFDRYATRMPHICQSREATLEGCDG